ncbi:hypothetical protein J31TS6_57100 [Brevibacillus reuszeri]|uniref:hypothetical protein n=1 Tax=Brevibacillus reuszeri TaxID=54915 RepID=UPI001B0C1A8E|nr:hypothetical protein [Brevibacillus reuszeri]GIO09682.1 hypothetical protein J31TS6_57100 [Brevibacillus reuszeri]
MIGLFYRPISSEKALVTTIHYFPGSLSEEDKANNFIEVPFVPETAPDSSLFVNPQTKEMWHENVELPSSEIERINNLEKATEENKQANLDTQEAVLQLYEMVTGPPA